jgi:hypothetical protein
MSPVDVQMAPDVDGGLGAQPGALPQASLVGRGDAYTYDDDDYDGEEANIWDALRDFPFPTPEFGYYDAAWAPPSTEEVASPLAIVGLKHLILRHTTNCPRPPESQVRVRSVKKSFDG